MSAEARDDRTAAAHLLAAASVDARGAPERVEAAAADLFTPDAFRQTERQRATMARLLDRIVGDIEIDLRARIAAALDLDVAADFQQPDVPIAAPLLRQAGLLRDPALIALLLARAEEHRLAADMRRRALGEGETPRSPLDSADPDTARAQMALIIAESRRFDRIEEPELLRDDLPAELLQPLVWRIAAALRSHLLAFADADARATDEAISAAVAALFDEHDEGRALDASAHRLARRLNAAGGIDDARLLEALGAGRFALLLACLAVRAGLDPTAVRAMALDPTGARLAVLLRAIGVARATAVSILVDLVPLDDAGLAMLVDAYDALNVAEAIDALRPLRLPEAYRAANAGLAAALAERA